MCVLFALVAQEIQSRSVILAEWNLSSASSLSLGSLLCPFSSHTDVVTKGYARDVMCTSCAGAKRLIFFLMHVRMLKLFLDKLQDAIQKETKMNG